MEDATMLPHVIRHHILTATSAAGSGHPTSSMSATELMTELFFGGWLKYDTENPHAPENDRIIFSKGHAAPLLYALYTVAGVISPEELATLRQFDSVLEGHPTPRFEPVEVSTGSLGQGLSVGMGMALAIQKRYNVMSPQSESNRDDSDRSNDSSANVGNSDMRLPMVWVLMGDSEIAEGQIWEAANLAAYYRLHNLVGIVDVNRLGQRGETMDGWDVEIIAERFIAFGWDAYVIEDGHDTAAVRSAYEAIEQSDSPRPRVIVARTKKGSGVSFLEDKDGWHGKAVPQDKLAEALAELGEVDATVTAPIAKPRIDIPPEFTVDDSGDQAIEYSPDVKMATREAYGKGLCHIGSIDSRLIALDAETSNSTFAEMFKDVDPNRFVELYIAEQNMVSAAVGMSKLGYIPYISSFAAFFTRAFDQIRMAQYAEANLKVIGSHAGVSIGQDGSSQMALEDLAMMRSILDSVVLYPSDPVSAEMLLVEMHNHEGISYMRLTREKTGLLYSIDDEFMIGGSKVIKESPNDTAVIVAAGITVHEALKAYNVLSEKGVSVAVVDAYSVKPLDEKTIKRLAKKTGHVIVVEDHYPYGGLGDAVSAALSGTGTEITHRAVTKIPRSGTPQELLAYEEIDADAIIKAVL